MIFNERNFKKFRQTIKHLTAERHKSSRHDSITFQ